MKREIKLKLKIATFILFFIIIFILLIHRATALRINEIMYDPSGSDDGKEYIEVFEENCNSANNQVINASMLKLFENNVSHGLQFNNSDSLLCGYYIIVNDVDAFVLAYNHTNISTNTSINTSVIVKSSFSLSNTGEFIAIKNSTNTLSFFDYRNFTNIANGNGKSLEFFNGSWYESTSNGTPGAINSIETVYEQTNLTDLIDLMINLTNSTNPENVSQNTSIFTNNSDINNSSVNNPEIMNSTQNSQNFNYTNISENQTILQNNYISKSCNITISIAAQDVFDDNKIKYYNILSNSSFDFEIEYWIEDLEGNIVKSKISTTNQEQKSWTAGKDSAYIIKNRIKWVDCNNSALKTSSEKLIVIKNNSYAVSQEISFLADGKDNQSKIILIEINGESEKPEFNKSLSARIVIYKGNTLKTVVNVWIENETKKFSDVFKFYSQQKYSENEIIAILNLKDINACAPVNAYVVVEGLGILARHPIVIENTDDSCHTINTNQTVKSSKSINKITGNATTLINNQKNDSKNLTLNKGSVVINSTAFLNGQQEGKSSASPQTESNLNDVPVENIKKEAVIVYESPLEKAKKYVNFAMVGLFVLLIAIIWLKKDKNKEKNNIKEKQNTGQEQNIKQKNKSDDFDGKTGNKREDKRWMASLPNNNRNTWKTKRACREDTEGLHLPDKGEKRCTDY